jgi:hypothetical protein
MTCMTPELLTMHIVLGVFELSAVISCTVGIGYLVWKHYKTERANALEKRSGREGITG